MKNWKRGLSAALALALCAGTTAGCGKQNETENNNNDTEKKDEFVYVAEYIPIQGSFSQTFYNASFSGGYYYVASNEQERVLLPIPEDVDFGDGGGIGIFGVDDAVEEETDEPAAEPEDGGEDGIPEGYYESWEYHPVVYKIGIDGSCEKVNFTLEEPEQPEGDNVRDFYAGSNVQSIAAGPNGTLYLMVNSYMSWSDAPEGVTWETDEYFYEKYYHDENRYAIQILSADGTVTNTVNLNALQENSEDYFYVNSFKVAANGEIYVTSDQTVYLLNADGSLKCTASLDGDGWMNGICTLPDGRAAVMVSSGSGWNLQVLDTETGSFGDKIGTPPAAYSLIQGAGDYDFYYTNGSNFFGFKLQSGEDGESAEGAEAAGQDKPEAIEPEKILNWINCDVDINNARNVVVLEDGRILCLSSQYGGGVIYAAASTRAFSDENSVTAELTILKKVPADSVPKKEIITLATQSLGYDMRSQIIAFNKSSDKYHIEVQDYSEYNNYYSDDEADYTAGLTKLKTEIMSGVVPDIIDLNGMPMRQFAARGLLEDLYSLIDSDPELKREDLMENILRAFETDGKLYQTVSSVTVTTILGAASVVGDKPGWTLQQFKSALAQMPEGCTAFNQYMTRPDILQYCLYLDIDNFVNWSTGETNFNNDAFVSLLEFAASFPSEFDWESIYGEGYEWSEEDDEYWRIAHGLQMLEPMTVSGFSELQMWNGLFGGKVTCIGFPTEYGTGNMFQTDGSQFAISTKCANKEAAWSFLRQFFTEDYQLNNRYGWGFPVNKNAFNQRLTEAMTPEYQMDENGNYVLDENGNRIVMNQYSYEWYEGVVIDQHPVTREEADQIMELLDTTTKVLDFDQSIYDIVNEESAAFFAGQKSAQEVARLVQSKVMLYVGEQQ